MQLITTNANPCPRPDHSPSLYTGYDILMVWNVPLASLGLSCAPSQLSCAPPHRQSMRHKKSPWLRINST